MTFVGDDYFAQDDNKREVVLGGNVGYGDTQRFSNTSYIRNVALERLVA